LPGARLYRYNPGFSSLADFHLHHSSTKRIDFPVVEGGKGEVLALFEKFGIRKKRVEQVAVLDWSQ
jgi:hypothetical protein